MNHWRVLLLSLAILLPALAQSDASLSPRLLLRRQSNEDSGPESTTPRAQSQGATPSTQPPRLYPDLPRPPAVAFVPPFGGANQPNHANHGPASFVPFGFQMPNNRFVEPPFRPTSPGHMSPTERLQSQTFTSGLGRRLLSLMGIRSSSNDTNNETSTAPNEPQSNGNSNNNNNNIDETMKALRNSTVLRQLNSGVQSIYGSLSRMYNATVQQQLDLLQERYKKETSNSTDPWQQRMAQQVPQFFRAMAMKVNEAQENLNGVWRQVAHASNSTNNGVPSGATSQPQVMSSRSPNSVDQMMGNGQMFGGNDGGGFLNHIGRSFGFGTDPLDDPLNQRQDFGSKLMDFWHNQVQPQMGMVRGQVMRIWRDLTSSGALRPGVTLGGGSGRGNDMGSNNGTTDIVDDVLKEIEVNEPEFKLVDSRTGNEQTQPTGMPPIMPRVQNSVVTMQRELNQLWNGLTNSIQNALTMMSARRSGMNNPTDNNNREMDPTENEISDRLKDLSKLQKDADVVYETVQRQQQAQQQRPSFTDRFRNFLGNVDFRNMDQLGNRFGNMIGDMWN